jgi:hypothetical protein
MAFKNDVADDMATIGHSVWHPIRPPLGTPSGPPSGTLSSTRWAFRSVLCSSLPPPFALPPDILIFSRRFCHPSPRPAPPSDTMIWSRRFGKCSSCPPSDLPRLALPSGTPSGTLVSSCGFGRPYFSEPLDRCPFGPPTGALPYTYIKPSTPPLHHFLHSPIRVRTYDCVATAALHGSWWWGAGSNCWVQTLSVFFFTIYVGEGWSLTLFSPKMTVVATVTAREEEGAGVG